MIGTNESEKCLAFVQCQLHEDTPPHRRTHRANPAVTISRMAGSGGRDVAAKLAEYLQKHAPGDRPWTVFDKELIEKVLEDEHLSQSIAEFLPEDHRSLAMETIEEIFGLHPSSRGLVERIARTIMELAQIGNVIILGRGSNIVTSRLGNVLNVRLVGSLERRVERLQSHSDLGPKEALAVLNQEDRGRRRYLRQHFHRDINDPTIYHLVLNTDRLDGEEIARLIGSEVIRRFQLEPATSQKEA